MCTLVPLTLSALSAQAAKEKSKEHDSVLARNAILKCWMVVPEQAGFKAIEAAVNPAEHPCTQSQQIMMPIFFCSLIMCRHVCRTHMRSLVSR